MQAKSQFCQKRITYANSPAPCISGVVTLGGCVCGSAAALRSRIVELRLGGIDEDVLHGEGIQDLAPYSVIPGGSLQRDLFL